MANARCNRKQNFIRIFYRYIIKMEVQNGQNTRVGTRNRIKKSGTCELKKAKTSGFRARKGTNVLKSRRAKGRKELSK